MLANVEQCGFILVRVGSKCGHGASWWRHHGSSCSIFGVHGVSWRALGGTMGDSMALSKAVDALSGGQSWIWGIRGGKGWVNPSL